jgi:hypothetical protein
MFPHKEKLALFIDGANLYATAKSLGFDIDYKRLLREFQSRGDLLRAFYYTAVIEDQEFSSIRPLIDWLDYNGYTVVTKPTKEFVDQTGRRKIKGNMDIELAVDAMELAGHIDHMVLFSGDSSSPSRMLAATPGAPRRPTRRWRGERSKAIRLTVRDHHRRSLCGKSPAQSEQWCCWFGRRRIISGSGRKSRQFLPSQRCAS